MHVTMVMTATQSVTDLRLNFVCDCSFFVCMINLLLSIHKVENFGNNDGSLGDDSCGNNDNFPRTFSLIFTRVRILD